VLLLAGAGGVFALRDDSDGKQGLRPEPEQTAFVPKRAFLQDACKLPPKWVQLIHRGWAPGDTRDADLVIVPKEGNYVGNFHSTSHSGPYDFLQRVPLIFYGSGYVQNLGRISPDREVSLVDVAPTVAQMMHFDSWPSRQGATLTEVIKPNPDPPPLVVQLMMDGAGWNDLEYWPDRWPNLERLMNEGTNFDNAIVGSSPSITPAIHTNLATGTFPRFHGVTGITVRQEDGSITGGFSLVDRLSGAENTLPDIAITKSTIADEWDLANGNEPKIGALLPGNYPLGMVGIGTAQEGGDADLVGMSTGTQWATKSPYFFIPDYINSEELSVEPHIDAVDRADGEADGQWQGHDIRPIDATPALAPWQTQVAQELIVNEGFGEDGLTDMFFMNYKAPDYAGHEWNMIAPEQGDVIESVDAAIGDFVTWLDDNIGPDNYVLIISADHGQTPLEAGGWPIVRSEVLADVNGRFDKISNKIPLIEGTSATSLFFDAEEMKRNKVAASQTASFLSRYTVGANVPPDQELPEDWADRADERVFSAVFPGGRLPDVVECTGALERA
jgi:Type I phosphodiesterase / nucleotide pyrophosphatase